VLQCGADVIHSFAIPSLGLKIVTWLLGTRLNFLFRPLLALTRQKYHSYMLWFFFAINVNPLLEVK
jgi:hypothetical protein